VYLSLSNPFHSQPRVDLRFYTQPYSQERVNPPLAMVVYKTAGQPAVGNERVNTSVQDKPLNSQLPNMVS